MKKTLNITVVLALLAVALGAYLWIGQKKPRPAPTQEEWKPEYVFNYDGAVSRVTFKNAVAEMVFQWDEDLKVYKMASPVDAPLDAMLATTFFQTVWEIKKERIVTPHPEDLGKFQLDQPAGRVVAHLPDGDIDLLIGKPNYTQDYFYAKLASEPTVFLIDRKISQFMILSVEDFRSKALLLHPVEAVQYISLEILDEEIRNKHTSAFDFTLARQTMKNGKFQWDFTSPFNEWANTGRVHYFLMRFKLSTNNYIHEMKSEEELAGFGLDKPVMRITLGIINGSKEVVEIGNYDPENNYWYARNLARNEVVAIGDQFFGELVEQPFREHTILAGHLIRGITRFEVSYPREGKELALVVEKEKLFNFDDGTSDKSTFGRARNLVGPFSDWDVRRFIYHQLPYPRDRYGLDPPRVRIKAFNGDTKIFDVAAGDTVNDGHIVVTYVEEMERHFIAQMPFDVYQDIPIRREHLVVTDERELGMAEGTIKGARQRRKENVEK